MGVQQDAQSYAERAHLYSSRIGTVWWFVNFFFRVLIVGGMAKDFLGLDKMKDHYYCNNISPGCKEACFSDFQPIEYWRLWVIEIVFVAAPAIFFVIYASKETVRVKVEEEKNDEMKKRLASEGGYHDGSKYYKKKTKVNYLNTKYNDKHETVDIFMELGKHGNNIRKVFIIHLAIRLVIEVTFLVIYWLIQAGQHRNFNSIFGVWSTPHTFLCSHAQSPSWLIELKNSDGQVSEVVDVFSPCKTDSSVYCYVPRYRERTIMILYMAIINCVSIVLTFSELCYMTVLQVKKNSEEQEIVLKPPHANPKWSRASSDDIVFNKAGEK